jgi:hypothetical protein
VALGDRLELGAVRLRFAVAPITLTVASGLGAGQRYAVTRGATVGRSVAADVTILDLTCSRNHCRLDRDPAGRLVLTDLGSTTGTWLGGRRLPAGVPTPVSPGAELRVGETSLVLSGDPFLPDREADRQAAVTALAAVALDRAPTTRLSRAAHLTGNLSGMSFSQVVQLLSNAGKSGELLVETPKGRAGVRFRRGQVEDAYWPRGAAAPSSPEERFLALTRLRRGRFSFRQERPSSRRGPIARETLGLLIEAARRADEAPALG